MKLVKEYLNESSRELVFNRHSRDFREDFTIEFNVKDPKYPETLSDKILDYEWNHGTFINKYATKCFNEIQKSIKKRAYWYIVDWSLAGRSGGWFALLCNGNPEKVSNKDLETMEIIVEKYFINFGREMAKFYNNVSNYR